MYKYVFVRHPVLYKTVARGNESRPTLYQGIINQNIMHRTNANLDISIAVQKENIRYAVVCHLVSLPTKMDVHNKHTLRTTIRTRIYVSVTQGRHNNSNQRILLRTNTNRQQRWKYYTTLSPNINQTPNGETSQI